KLFNALTEALGPVPIIAEDLGLMFDSVRQLLKESGYPGMKVLQFAFDPNSDSEYLPHNYPVNSVAYPGTHDNATAVEWATSFATPAERKKVHDIPGRGKGFGACKWPYPGHADESCPPCRYPCC
ncbi:Glycoside hydrolase, family 77, partial [gut metagenome]